MALRALVTAAACLAALGIAWPAAAADALRSLAQGAGIRIGTSVDTDALSADAAYAQLLAREFDLVTPENALKFSVVQPERGRFDFPCAPGAFTIPIKTITRREDDYKDSASHWRLNTCWKC